MKTVPGHAGNRKNDPNKDKNTFERNKTFGRKVHFPKEGPTRKRRSHVGAPEGKRLRRAGKNGETNACPKWGLDLGEMARTALAVGRGECAKGAVLYKETERGEKRKDNDVQVKDKDLSENHTRRRRDYEIGKPREEKRTGGSMRKNMGQRTT